MFVEDAPFWSTSPAAPEVVEFLIVSPANADPIERDRIANQMADSFPDFSFAAVDAPTPSGSFMLVPIVGAVGDGGHSTMCKAMPGALVAEIYRRMEEIVAEQPAPARPH